MKKKTVENDIPFFSMSRDRVHPLSTVIDDGYVVNIVLS